EEDLGLDLRVFLAAVSGFVTDDYVDAQRMREAMREELARALLNVDVLALPTTANVAPTVTDAEMRSGFIDPEALDAACPYAFLGNLSGLPAGTAPIARNASGLPIGLQIVGDAWDEACVLQVLAALERAGAVPVRPAGAVDLLA